MQSDGRGYNYHFYENEPMKLLTGVQNFPEFKNGASVTIGNFDGVHLGHQGLITCLVSKARQLGIPSVVVVFEPQPREYFRGTHAEPRLYSLREKAVELAKLQVDYLYCLPFKKVVAINAQHFAQKYLFNLLKAKCLIVGEDFRFGANREGDFHLLKTIATANDCQIDCYKDFIVHGDRVSSTRIRQLLYKGELNSATKLLGRPFGMWGRVTRGNRRGHQWGIPTANISLCRRKPALSGVFCVNVTRANGQVHAGVANLGTRPSVDGLKNVLEVHLLDFDENIYGEMLEIHFYHKLREEKKFTDVQALIQQIRKDITEARDFFQSSLSLNSITE